MVGDPKILILDEPTVGLDPAQMIQLRELVSKLGEEHTVILSSHILSEIQAVCDSILIIANGELIVQDTPQNLKAHLGGECSVSLLAKASKGQALAVLSTVSDALHFEVTSEENGVVRAQVSGAPDMDLREAVFAAFSAAGLPILEMQMTKSDLEDVFLTLTKTQGETKNESNL